MLFRVPPLGPLLGPSWAVLGAFWAAFISNRRQANLSAPSSCDGLEDPIHHLTVQHEHRKGDWERFPTSHRR